jgi:L-histidine Nalpha-methyltransferase
VNDRAMPHSSQFARDVLAGLTSAPKSLSSKYFYDDEGSRLFRQIMTLPEYYLTRAEMRVFTEQGSEICRELTEGVDELDLVELGAGDGSKTAVLLERLLKAPADISYSPIDISQEANDELSANFRRRFPGLRVAPLTGDYLQALSSLRSGGRRKVILFLGSNIGNFPHGHAVDFFRSLREVVGPNDRLLTGFDMQKDPRVILAAYDDRQGVTAAFNLNLLRRINRELGGNFDLSKFSHYAQFHPVECAARSFLISREKQMVTIPGLGRSFEFGQWEPIFMEISQKYTSEMVRGLAADSGFAIRREFANREDFYVDSLWQPA